MEEQKSRKKIAVVGSNIMATGFKIAGVKNAMVAYLADSQEDIEQKINELFADETVAVIVAGQSTLAKVRDRKLLQLIDTSLLPIVVGIPDYHEKEENEDTLRRLIKRAIGIDIKMEAPPAAT
jgi:vacuolar-type H+-ATPase subunit F/Vma7